MDCSVAEVMEAIGDRWGLLIMRDLLLGLTRYDDLRKSSGVTNATLSDRLKRLEQAGLVERRLYQARPDRHDYAPSDRGRDLALLIQAMTQIGDKWRAADRRKIPMRFVDARSGRALALIHADAKQTNGVDQPRIVLEAGPGADEIMKWRLAQGQPERTKRAAALS